MASIREGIQTAETEAHDKLKLVEELREQKQNLMRKMDTMRKQHVQLETSIAERAMILAKESKQNSETLISQRMKEYDTTRTLLEMSVRGLGDASDADCVLSLEFVNAYGCLLLKTDQVFLHIG